MSENRWGGTTGPTPTKKPGAVRRGAARARDWADDKTGRRMSTGWKAARGQEGFKNRRKAAGQAVKDAGGGGIIAAIVGVVAALFAGAAGLFGGGKKKPGDTEATPADTTPNGEAAATGTGPADTPNGTPEPNATSSPQATGSTDPRVHETWDADSTPPTTTTTSINNTGGNTTMRNDSRSLPHAVAAAELNAQLAKAGPQDLFEVMDQAKEWEDFVRDSTMAIRRYVQQIQGNRIPLGPASIQSIQDLFTGQSQLIAAAQAIPKTISKEHAEDENRRQNLRGDETKSNV